MILNYFISFCRANKVKIVVLVISIGLYFTLAVTLLALDKILPELAALPFEKIGVQTIVQKGGVIPEHMTGGIFPHSNGPIYSDEITKLNNLDFVESSDKGLYFWYFGDVYKNTFGVDENGPVFANLLKQNIEVGSFALSDHQVLVTKDFAQKKDLSLGDKISFGQEIFSVSAILRSNVSGNIVPADVYMSLPDSQNLAYKSSEMKRAYKFSNSNFINVVALNSNPNWQGDKEKMVKNLDKDFIVFSQKTFSKEVAEQLKVISSLGKVVFVGLGFVMLVIFSLLAMYNFKTREKEIAVLRMVGWELKDLRKQFISEGMILLAVALIVGNIISFVVLAFLKTQSVTMELPWELSARPHFMPQENAIDRVISANLPVRFDPVISAFITLIFFLVFGIIYYISFQRIKNIKPSNYLK